MTGKVEQAVLAHLRDKTVQPEMDRLVWVLVMSDDSYVLSADADYMAVYLNVVDANSGEWLFGYGEEATCGQTPETMAECEKRGITPKAPVVVP